MAKAILLLIVAILCVYLNKASADGTATYYIPPYVPTACGITDPNKLPSGHGFGGVGYDIWNGGAACGSKYEITCTGGALHQVPHPCRGGSVTVQIVDLCPGCLGPSFNLPEEAFAVIADPNEGKITINSKRV